MVKRDEMDLVILLVFQLTDRAVLRFYNHAHVIIEMQTSKSHKTGSFLEN